MRSNYLLEVKLCALFVPGSLLTLHTCTMYAEELDLATATRPKLFIEDLFLITRGNKVRPDKPSRKASKEVRESPH